MMNTAAGATQVGRNPRHMHSAEGFVIEVAHQLSLQSVSSSSQRFGSLSPDTILPGYRRAPQWVPARTPTVHWGLVSGKAVGGPVGQYSTANSAENTSNKNSFLFIIFSSFLLARKNEKKKNQKERTFF